MPNRFSNKTIIQQYIAENKLPPTCSIDMEVALLDVLDENDEVKNIAAMDAFVESRPHLITPEAKRSRINMELERAAFGQGNATARGALFREYGEHQYAERMVLWGASPTNGKLGTEPGQSSEETIKKAAAIVKRDDAEAKNPFNPKMKFGSDQVRQNEIAKFIKFFGTKSAVAAATKYGVDIAGRPLRKRA